MVDKPELAENEESALDLRNKLIKRLAVAGVLVAILLGVLAFFDYLSTPPEEPVDAPVFTQPVPVAPKKLVSQPVTPAEELPETPPPVSVEPETPPPPPQPAAQPSLARPAAPDEQAVEAPRPAPRQKEPIPVAVKPLVEPKVLRPVPEVAVAPTPSPASVSRETPPAKPTARVVDSRSAPPVPPSGASRLFSGFLLQAGVFTSQQRAEELHAKLTLSGVPSTLETRVQVGPFHTRQEAMAAQVKLKELGIESVLVPPRSARH